MKIKHMIRQHCPESFSFRRRLIFLTDVLHITKYVTYLRSQKQITLKLFILSWLRVQFKYEGEKRDNFSYYRKLFIIYFKQHYYPHKILKIITPCSITAS